MALPLRAVTAIRLHRSEQGYGWWLTVGKRFRWCSRKGTTPMWPRIRRGGDENCNRAITVVLWPLGHLDFWWEPKWRTGPCDECRAERRAEGICERCGCRPCLCDEKDRP